VHRVFVDIIEIRFLRPVLAQLHRHIVKVLISGDGHHLWSWQETQLSHEVGFLRRYSDLIVRLINTAHIHLEALAHPHQLLSRLDKTALDGARVCNHQASLSLERLVSMLDIELQDVDYLYPLLKTPFSHRMAGNLLGLLFWVTQTWADSHRPAA
jgi:hypothetical protein